MGNPFKSPKVPKAPDYAGLAKTDAEEQRKTALQLTAANRPTQIDAMGNRIDWSQDAAGNWTQKETYNPELLAGKQGMQTAFYDKMGKLAQQPDFVNPSELKYSAANGGEKLKDFSSEAGAVSDFAPPPTGYGTYSNSGGYSGGSPSIRSSVSSGGGAIKDMAKKAGPLEGFVDNSREIGTFDRTQGDRVAADMYESAMSRVRPEQEREQRNIDNQLRQQGLQPGTAAYDRAMKNLMTSHGDVSSKAALDSTGAGYAAAGDIFRTELSAQDQEYGQGLTTNQQNQSLQNQRYNQIYGQDTANRGWSQQALEGSIASMNHSLAASGQAFNNSLASAVENRNAQAQRYGQEMSTADFNRVLNDQRYNQSAENSNRHMAEQGQMFNQALTTYQTPMNSAQGYAQLFNSQPGSNYQGFSGATGYNPASMTNAAQNTYNANMGAANAQSGKQNNLLQAGTTLGSAYMRSDMSLKENIQPLNGKDALAVILKLGGYEYNWKDTGEEDMGVLAQQVEKVLPDLVVRAEEGHLMVKYQGIVAIAIEAIRYLAGDNK